ncbi:MAG: hypothetical protein KDK36_03590 [Leptospiraceae bacterium]|nr:hypothetical protein [Leptospiraceae bacterium]
MKKIIFLLISIITISLYTQDTKVIDSSLVDLDELKPEEIKVGKSEGSNEDMDAKEQFHEKLKAVLRKSRSTGVIFKDKSNRIFTNGEYKFKLNPLNPSELFSHIEFKIDNAEYKRYVDPIPLEEEGLYKLAYRGVDKLENLEELKSYSIRVDRTPPEVIVDLIGEEFKGEDGNIYYKPGVQLDVRGYDKSSGLNMIIVNIDRKGNLPYSEIDKTISGGGEHEIAVRGLDNVYNLSKKTRVSFWIDNKKPTASHKILPELKIINDKKFCKVDSTIRISAKDRESGLNKIEYSYDNAKWQDYGNPLTVPKIDEYKLYYRAIDNTGNVSDPVEFTCLVDYTPPRTNIKVSVK